jgi:hypothetical protein
VANRFRGEAALIAGTETLMLVVDINALILAEEETGLALKPLLDELDGSLRLKMIRALLWSALQANHPCNLLRAGEIIGEAGIAETREALAKAVAGAFPPRNAAEGGAKPDPQKAAGGTGNDSTADGAL